MKLKSDDLMYLKKIIDHIKICITNPSAEDQLAGVPMSSLVLNDEGKLCFFSSMNEGEIDRNAEVFLTYADPVNKFLYSTWGKANLCPEGVKGQTLLKIESMELEDDGMTFNHILRKMFN
jgi:hypothetical protein